MNGILLFGLGVGAGFIFYPVIMAGVRKLTGKAGGE